MISQLMEIKLKHVQWPYRPNHSFSGKTNVSRSTKPCISLMVGLGWCNSKLLFAVLIAMGLIGFGTTAKAWAQDCYSNRVASHAMQEVRQNFLRHSLVSSNTHWYSTQNSNQAAKAYQLLANLPNLEEVPHDLEQPHFLNVDNKAFMLLFTNNKETCGFTNVKFVDVAKGRHAVSASEEFIMAMGRIPDDTDEQMQEQQFPAKSQLMGLRDVLSSSDLRKRVPKKFCEKLEVDSEIGVVPELEELEVNSTLRGVEVEYFYVKNGSSNESKIENFFKNAVGGEDAGWFNRIQHVILIPNNENTDIILGNHQHLCGFGSFASFPAELVNSWFEPHKGPKRSTQLGDPIYNMTDEERRAFQMMQGIFNGENPEQGFKELFSGMK